MALLGHRCLSLCPVATGEGLMATEDVDWLDLPGRWAYGVCRDGRIFFVKYVPFWLFFF